MPFFDTKEQAIRYLSNKRPILNKTFLCDNITEIHENEIECKNVAFVKCQGCNLNLCPYHIFDHESKFKLCKKCGYHFIKDVTDGHREKNDNYIYVNI